MSYSSLSNIPGPFFNWLDDGFEIIEIALNEIIFDEADEVVLCCENKTAFSIVTDSQLLSSSISDEHITYSGFDVTNFFSYLFSNGSQVYCDKEVAIIFNGKVLDKAAA